jgi:glutathione S-transferase
MHEKGIANEVEEVILDLAPGGQQRGWQYLERNPWGETPTMELPGGGYLAGTVAVTRTLDGSFPGGKIMGEAEPARRSAK